MLLSGFFKNCAGGVAPMLALGAIPLVTAVGMAVDYSRANATRSAMQAAGDATALMLAKGASSMNGTQLQTNASTYFQANFNRPETQNLLVNATYTQGATGYTLKVDAAAGVNTVFLGLIGYSQIPLSTTATASWNNQKLRVALVLDNTGSMSSSGKMTALKTATHNLLSQLQSAATNNGDVYVSIIPFAKDVNVGASNYTQSWINWSGSSDTWDENNGVCSSTSYTNKSSCISHSKIWTPNNHNTWTGCVMDRDQNFDTTNTAPTSGGTLFPAEQYAAYCPTQLMGLTYDWTALNAKVDAMQPAGGTNQAIGLQWGFQSLTAAPFTIPTKDPNYQYKEIVILLTDGLNTQDRWYGNGSQHSTSVDNRQQILCNNVKAANITIYTVQVNTDGDPTSTLLQNCASDTSKFFMLTSANQIITTFNTIGTSLKKLYLAK
jgi:Flp pilus assembly protein TadG